MVITHHGNQFIKLQYGDVTVAVNPISKDSKQKGARFGADVCLISINHEDFNGADQVAFGDRQPFTIKGPGEYETKGIFVKGVATTSSYGGEQFVNTAYIFSLDSISMCFLGALDTKDIPKELSESVEEVDMLFVPIGGNGVLSAADAYKLAVQFEPKVIVPLGMDSDGAAKDALKVFLKEGGGEDVKPVDKLTLKKKDLDGKEGDIIILASS